MVYSVRDNRQIVSKTPLKTKRVQSERSKQLEAYTKANKISVQTGADGRVVVKSIKVEHE